MSQAARSCSADRRCVSTRLSLPPHQSARDELAGILIYLVHLADVLDSSLKDAVETKLQSNERKYPVAIAKGNTTKYNRRN